VTGNGMRALSLVLRWSSRTVACLLLVLLAAPFAWQAATGDTFLTVTGVSMKPTYHLGDVLIVRAADGDELRTPGRIVVAAFGSGGQDGALYVHRVWQVTEDGAILKGDGNDAPDPRPVTAADIVGTPRAHVTGVAATVLATSQDLIARLVLVALTLLLGLGVPALLTRPSLARRLRDERPPTPSSHTQRVGAQI